MFISDKTNDLDYSSRVIRDIYTGGFDISLYVPADITKFHKSQNIKYKINANDKVKKTNLLSKKDQKEK